MSTKIFLVCGGDGEYEDYCTWIIKAFSVKSRADTYISFLEQRQQTYNSFVPALLDHDHEWNNANPRNESIGWDEWEANRNLIRREFIKTIDPFVDEEMLKWLTTAYYSHISKAHYYIDDTELD